MGSAHPNRTGALRFRSGYFLLSGSWHTSRVRSTFRWKCPMTPSTRDIAPHRLHPSLCQSGRSRKEKSLLHCHDDATLHIARDTSPWKHRGILHELLIGVLACIRLTLEFVPPGRCGEDLLACSDSAPQEGSWPGCLPTHLRSFSGSPLSPGVMINPEAVEI